MKIFRKPFKYSVGDAVEKKIKSQKNINYQRIEK